MDNLIAIIPARGGSKRIPGKNIKPFCGKPIISYSINAALKSSLFSEVMVSTDDENIAEIAKSYGANVPFLRSHDNSNDFATTSEVLLEVLEQYKESYNTSFRYGCCIYPTAPFVNEHTLINSYKKLLEKNCDVIFPVISFSYPIWRSLKMNSDGKVSMNWPEHINSRSQDLPKVYHDAGQFYWFNVTNFINNKVIFAEEAFGYEIDDLMAQDIDNETDWKLAELKYKMLINND